LCRARKFEEGAAALRRAQELDPKSAAVRGALIGTLIEQARASLDQDWQVADSLAEQVLSLDPANAQAKSLRTLALDKKREEFVDQCVAQARRLQGEGQPEAALGEVDRGLAEHPRDPRLSQLRTTLTKSLRETQAAGSGCPSTGARTLDCRA
jgi:tetratricopeptide (TPR) repeat protein